MTGKSAAGPPKAMRLEGEGCGGCSPARLFFSYEAMPPRMAFLFGFFRFNTHSLSKDNFFLGGDPRVRPWVGLSIKTFSGGNFRFFFRLTNTLSFFKIRLLL